MARDEIGGPSVASWASLAVLAAGIVLFGVWSVHLGQDANWDFRNYHIYNGYAFLTGRWGHDVAPAQLQSFLNPSVYAPTYYLLSHTPPRVFGFVLGAVHGVNFWLIFLIAQTLCRTLGAGARMILSLLCAAAGTTGVLGLCEIGTTFHDLTTGAFVLAAVVVYARARFGGAQLGPARWAAVGLAGVVLGIGIGLKYTLASYALGFAVAVATEPARVRQRIACAAVWGFGVVVGFALSAGHWMLRLYRAFGNPLFPYYNTVFRSPYAEISDYKDERFQKPTSLIELIQFPFISSNNLPSPGETWEALTLGMELRFQDLRLAIVTTLAAVTAILWASRRWGRSPWHAPRPVSIGGQGVGRWLFVFFFTSYVIWLKQFAIYRYAAALEMLSPVVACYLLGQIATGGMQLVGLAAVELGLGAVTLQAPDWGRVPWGPRVVDVAVPSLERPERTIVVMTSGEPIAYAITAFPPEVRFVRIQSNFFAPHVTTPLAAKVRTVLASPDIDYRVFTTKEGLAQTPALVASYGFGIAPDSCAALRSNLDQNLVFCRLERLSRQGTDAMRGSVP